ncbi:DUF1232 domain-containing protein [Ectobacillus polymachus]|uniref:DUF1232 domain-containing protein n=1 Tax=Ectobacillus polymachus TaxID=1508806 RepID=UPI003A8519F7
MSENHKENDLGMLLKSLLKKHALSMRKLSAITGIDTATISRIINGKQQAKLEHLQQFASHLNIPLGKLIEAAGFEISREADPQSDPSNLVDIQKILASIQLVDTEFTIARVEQELAKYEQYAQTEEGHQLICKDFQTKIEQNGSVGPLIEQLKQLYIQYCDDKTSTSERTIIGSALLYFILSVDIIPDYIFPIGYLDDAIAIQLVLNRLGQ